ncbi:MAG TPA: hypothetical protein VFI25_12875 [Planctomycetota bacterium]|jgi:hypothetical protein|nr:hypothetical protein [Planctomycetota bacterium]
MKALAIALSLLPGPAGFCGERDPTPQETEAVEAFLRRFDAACQSGNCAEVRALFCDSSRSCRKRCEDLLLPGVPGCVRRSSSLLLLRVSRERFGAFVRADLERAVPAEGGGAPLRERFPRHEFLLLRGAKEGPRLVTILEFDPEGLAMARSSPVTCDWCNWQLEKPPGWFSVYRSRECCGATEAVSFVPPEGEPTIEFRVFELPDAEDPLEATRRDDERLCRELGQTFAVANTVSRRAVPSGAESEFRFVSRDGGPARVLRSYVLRDRTLYALVAAGPEPALQGIAKPFGDLRNSFALVDLGRSGEETRREMLRHHPGGSLSGNAYSYEGGSLRLALRAPEGWTGVETSGPVLFRVRFRPKETGEEAFLDFYAIHDAGGWFSERRVAREFESRARELRACGAEGIEHTPIASACHPGLRTVAHQSESTWTDAQGRAVRELFLFAPFREEALCVVARAEAAAFERLRPLFEKAVEGLARR